MLAVFQWVIFALGLVAIILACRFLWFFSYATKSLSWAMRWLMAEQVVSAGGTLLFSVNSLVGTVSGLDSSNWNHIDPIYAQGIRLVMFSAMIHSTYRLHLEVSKIAEELKKADKGE